jgi:Putative zinc-finger
MRLSIFNRHPREELSSYLDGELIPLRTEAMQAHLASCPSCRAELEALRELKAGLTTMPEIAAPRSFALTPEMIARPLSERERPAVPARAKAMASGMRLAGAGMTLALVLVLVLDFTGSATKSGSAPNAANVQQFAVAQNSDSLSSAGGNPAAPTPAPTHNDLSNGPASFPTGTPLPSGLSSDSGPTTEIPATPGIAPARVGEAPSPAIVQTNGSPSADKSTDGTAESSATNAPAALNPQPSVFGAQQPGAASTGSGGGVDVLLIVALALAVGIVLTVAASFVLPRLGREDV